MEERFLKLTNAVYKVLEFFPESDPLKSRAKDRALSIMDNLVSITETSGWVSFQKEKVKVQVLDDIDVLLGYLWIAKSQGWLNSVNYLVISNKYENIKKDIQPVTDLIQGLPVINDLPVVPVIEDDNAPEQVLVDREVQSESSPVLGDAEVKSDHINISDRQKTILEFLGKNEKAQVMDLQTVLTNVTKRTIRRDLDELLGAGKIDRTGEFNQVFYKIRG